MNVRNSTMNRMRHALIAVPLALIGANFSAYGASADPSGPGGQHDCTASEMAYYGGFVAQIGQSDGSVIYVCQNSVPSTTLRPSTTPVSSSPPSGATSALVDLTMVDGQIPGYITADRCSALSTGSQKTSSGNHPATSAIANLAVVALDPDGRFCVYNQEPVNLVADVQGFFGPPSATGQTFVPSAPSRKLDTRIRPRMRPAAGAATRVDTGVAAGTTAVLVNLTMSEGIGDGYITADKCSVLVAGPQTTSSGNYTNGSTLANLAVVPVDPDGSFCIYNQTPVELIADLQGSFAPSGGLMFTAQAPTRRLDTRIAPLTRPASASVTRVDTGAAPGTVAVLANLTMTDGATTGYITADRCSALTVGPQTASSGNHGIDTPIADLAVVPVDGDGSFCIFNSSVVDIVVDVQGTFSASGTDEFTAIARRRVIDTRTTSPVALPTCDATAMTVTAMPQQGAAQSDNIQVILRNDSDQRCLVTGSPTVAVANGDGSTTAIASSFGLVLPMTHAPRPAVDAHESVAFSIGSSRACNDGTLILVPHLRVTLPNSTSTTLDATTARAGGVNIACGITIDPIGAPYNP